MQKFLTKSTYTKDLKIVLIANIENKLHSLSVNFDYDLNNNVKINFKILKFINMTSQFPNEREQDFYKKIEENSQMTMSIKYTI